VSGRDDGAAAATARRTPSGRRDLTLIAWLLVGAGARLLALYPVHRYYADADSSLTGIHALRILEGVPVVFFNGYRLGAVGCWVAAGLFRLFGATDAALAATPLLFDLGTLVVGALFVREVLGAKRARWALPLVALPPPAVTFWTTMPVAYAEVMFAAALCLWAAARVALRGSSPGRAALLGFALGLALWTSLLALVAALPALVWALWRRAGRPGRRAIAAALAALLVGSLPWWLANLGSGFPSLRANFAARAVDAGSALANLEYTVVTRLPELLASTRALVALVPSRALRHGGAALVMALWAVAALAALRELARRPRAAPTGASPRAAVALALAVTATVLAANAFSAAGARRPGEDTVRYLLPIALVLPILAASLRRENRRLHVLGAGAIAILVAWSAAGIFWPGHPDRRRWAAERAQDRVQAERLVAAGVEALAGSYSHVYPYNFLTRFAIAGLPVERNLDFLDVEAGLPERPLRWALLGRGAEDRLRLARCGALVLPGGRLAEVGSGRWLWTGGEFQPSGLTAPAQLELIRGLCPDLGRKAPPADPERRDG
jgi:4-amino-4-deoxy-L-arabinose transferase-like glycosyltransferase